MANKQLDPTDLKKEHEKSEIEEISGTGSVEMTDKSEAPRARGSFEKPPEGPSPMTSDTTSGIESRFNTPAGTPSEAGAVPVSSSGDASKKLDQPDKSELVPVTPATEESKPGEVEPTHPATIEATPHQKSAKSLTLGAAFRKIISPHKQDEDSSSPKKGKSGMSFLKNRFKASKSMSPPEKSMEIAADEPSHEQTEIAEPETSFSGVSPNKKPHKGIGSKIKKSLSSVAGFFSGNKGSATAAVPDAVGLVVDPEASEETVSSESSKEVEPESVAEESETVGPQSKFQPYWDDCTRTSFVSQTEAHTQLTDVPSIGSDVFLPDDTLSKVSSDDKSQDENQIGHTADAPGLQKLDINAEEANPETEVPNEEKAASCPSDEPDVTEATLPPKEDEAENPTSKPLDPKQDGSKMQRDDP